MAALKKDNPKTKRVIFKAQADPGSAVFLAGDFNQWNPTAKAMTDPKGTGDFSATLSLPPGQYAYKFVINDTWCADSNCATWVQNEVGTLNSLCRVE